MKGDVVRRIISKVVTSLCAFAVLDAVVNKTKNAVAEQVVKACQGAFFVHLGAS